MVDDRRTKKIFLGRKRSKRKRGRSKKNWLVAAKDDFVRTGILDPEIETRRRNK